MWEIFIVLALAICFILGVRPWIEERLAFRKLKASVAIVYIKPHGLKPGDHVMITNDSGLPFCNGNPWFKVVATPSDTTMMLAQRGYDEIQIQD